MRLLNSLSEPSAWEVNLPTEALLLVITKPILQQRCAIETVSAPVPENPTDKGEESYLSGAGQSELNLNPSRAWTIANSRVIARTAPLLAVYANCGVAAPTSATIDAVLITEARFLPCFRKLRTACFDPNHTPLTLMFIVRSQMSSGHSSASPSLGCIIPALLKITSSPPQESRCAIAASI